MKRLFEMIKNKDLWIDFLNLFTGIILVIVIIIFCLFPGNKAAIVLMFLLTGIMNLTNGVKKYKEKRTKNMGLTLIMISMITIFAGAMLLTGFM